MKRNSLYTKAQTIEPFRSHVAVAAAEHALRVTEISPGFVNTGLAESMTNPAVRAQILAAQDRMAISPDAIARATAFAIDQPADVDVNEIVVRPTAQI